MCAVCMYLYAQVNLLICTWVEANVDVEPYLSYFSIAMTKFHDQGNLFKKVFSWAYGF